MKRALAHLALFLLTVLEMVLGLIAGVAALVSVITEMVARATAAGGDSFARRVRIRPVSPRLRTEMATVLSGLAGPAAGGTR
ncbi:MULTISPECIES: hypothetical protein [Streptomyces]|uniref:Uncharacterized protein n=1 Tax=Streptomyces tsukubensis (strain DSM 42081 / NBRC 108919 / NRRL 18488 / 9993) TaxID=1114943 RepID=I2MT12_STRT9|nr:MULTISPECIES: hypothetical protein [Streptomyces]AZK98824.1 hypothetical protein B7R87_33225 [Streptomyces tsukubensis]EIF87909.1 hypothetical protein [Streptomyces tsukubensis NRRL18488]MYS66037.1 hypothetical protein [Streptomyces sp. SID5473]QKM65822.1 hypothetical protein STSU_000270 [Streptomyces tsukubensis NRRL18488]GGP93453.1 hypothetical protein GCM10010278_84350 [Streptomyces melanogenes]